MCKKISKVTIRVLYYINIHEHVSCNMSPNSLTTPHPSIRSIVHTSSHLNITYNRSCYIHISTSSQQGLYYIMMTLLTCHIQRSCIGLVRNKDITEAHTCTFNRRTSLKVNERSTEGEGAYCEGVEMTTSPDQLVCVAVLHCTHVGTHGMWY